MEGINGDIEAAEEAKCEELERCVAVLKTISAVFRRVATKEELTEAEGRRCVLAISGLKHTRKVSYFQITGSTIEVVDP